MSEIGYCSRCMNEWNINKEGEDCPDCAKHPLPEKVVEKKRTVKELGKKKK